MSPPALHQFAQVDNDTSPRKIVLLPKLTKSSRVGLHEWLVHKLHQERKEILLHLEHMHRNLTEQLLEQAPLDDYVEQQNSAPANSMVVSMDDFTLNEPFLDVSIEDSQPQPRPKQATSSPLQEVMVSNGDTDSPLPEDLQPDDDADAVSSDVVGNESGNAAVIDGENGRGASAIQDSMLVEFSNDEGTQEIHHATSYFESTPRGRAFEVFFAVMIFLNTCVMAANAQYRGLQLGYELQYRTYRSSADQAWPGGAEVFDVLEKFFTVLFTFEYIVRFYVERCGWFAHIWCYIDGLIVVFAWILFFKEDLLPINLTFVRLARFSKLMRVLRLMQSQEVFDSLKLLVAAIHASTNTLFWSLCVLLLLMCIAGLFMVQMLEEFLEDRDNDIIIQRRVFGYWGTFWRAMITMFEITFANWVPSCRLLVENVGEGYGSFYLVYRCVCGFAVLMVVQAVFIQQTMKTTQLDDHHLAKQKQRSKARFIHRVETMFKQLDKSGDGYLSWNEFEIALKEGDMEAMLAVFELEASDFESLFRLLDDGDGCISIEEFVNGIQHIKGNAREVDMLEVKQILKSLDTKLLDVRRHAEVLSTSVSLARRN